jgi:hypothetical protein
VATFDDTGAAAPVITNGSIAASDGAYSDKVALSMPGASVAAGTTYSYTVKAINAAGLSAASSADNGHRAAGTLYYQFKRVDGGWVDIGSNTTTSTYNDTGTPAPVITAGAAVASDGTYPDKVALSLSGSSIADGASKRYSCYLSSANATSVWSGEDSGYRGKVSVTYQWQRSAADSDANYSNINGATTVSYDDTGAGAPSDGSGRYYRCVENATGSTQVISSVDRGNRNSEAILNSFIPQVIIF